MQAESVFEHYSTRDETKVSQITVALSRWFAEIFGCQHRDMSRPFSRHGEGYRVCIACGARRQFDEKTWNTGGSFYFKPARPADLVDTLVDTKVGALRGIPVAAGARYQGYRAARLYSSR